jgi:integral membrane sensor domain MASE1
MKKLLALSQDLRKRFAAVPKETLGMLLFSLAFLIVGQIGRYVFATAQTYPAVILAPNGIALAALIKYGGKHWKYIAIAAIINAIMNGVGPFGAFLAAILYVLQAASGAAAFHTLKLD